MRSTRWAISMVLLFGLSLAAYAVPVAGTAVGAGDFTGSRSATGGGLTGNSSYATDFTISWAITTISGGYHYEYTFSDLEKDLSHLLLQVSDTFTANNIWNASPSFASGDLTTYSPSDPGNSNPGLPASIFGIKFAGGSGSTYTVSFDSDRAPMWGNFYAKDGRSGGANVWVYNNGLVNATSEDILDFIAVPDTRTPQVPEPATLALVAIGLTAAGVLKGRRKRK